MASATPTMPNPRQQREDEVEIPFFQRMSFDDACALKRIASLGGAARFVRVSFSAVAPSRLASLRALDLIALADGGRGTEAMLTEQGRQLGLPAALKIILAGPAGKTGRVA